MSVDPKLSVIIPIYQEPDFLVQSLLEWIAGNSHRPVEWIFTLAREDSSSSANLVRQSGEHKVVEAATGRSTQMNSGAASAGGDFLLFLHADTRLDDDWYACLQPLMKNRSWLWGAFNPAIQGNGPVLRLAEFWGRWRSVNLGIAYGDQAIFVERNLFHEIGGFCQNIDFMEELEMSRLLVKKGIKPKILASRAITSDRRWQTKGHFATSLKNALAFSAFYLGISRHLIKRFYFS